MDCRLVNYQWFLSEFNEVQKMDKQQLLTWIAGILTTLNEVSPNDPIPASSIYLAMGMNMSDYEIVRNMMLAGGWISTTSSTIALTQKGRDKAIELENAMAR